VAARAQRIERWAEGDCAVMLSSSHAGRRWQCVAGPGRSAAGVEEEVDADMTVGDVHDSLGVGPPPPPPIPHLHFSHCPPPHCPHRAYPLPAQTNKQYAPCPSTHAPLDTHIHLSTLASPTAGLPGPAILSSSCLWRACFLPIDVRWRARDGASERARASLARYPLRSLPTAHEWQYRFDHTSRLTRHRRLRRAGGC
jgi:hypothetical protein